MKKYRIHLKIQTLSIDVESENQDTAIEELITQKYMIDGLVRSDVDRIEELTDD